MRGGVTLQRRLSLAGRKPRISPDFVDRRDGVIQSMRIRDLMKSRGTVRVNMKPYFKLCEAGRPRPVSTFKCKQDEGLINANEHGHVNSQDAFCMPYKSVQQLHELVRAVLQIPKKQRLHISDPL